MPPQVVGLPLPSPHVPHFDGAVCRGTEQEVHVLGPVQGLHRVRVSLGNQEMLYIVYLSNTLFGATKIHLANNWK